MLIFGAAVNKKKLTHEFYIEKISEERQRQREIQAMEDANQTQVITKKDDQKSQGLKKVTIEDIPIIDLETYLKNDKLVKENGIKEYTQDTIDLC